MVGPVGNIDEKSILHVVSKVAHYDDPLRPSPAKAPGGEIVSTGHRVAIARAFRRETT